MKTVIAALLALLIASSTNVDAAKRGLKVDVNECLQGEPVMVQVAVYPGSRKVKHPTLGDLGGFATYNTRTKVHTLHIPQITHITDKDIKTLGHELIHAFCLDWHDEEYGL